MFSTAIIISSVRQNATLCGNGLNIIHIVTSMQMLSTWTGPKINRTVKKGCPIIYFSRPQISLFTFCNKFQADEFENKLEKFSPFPKRQILCYSTHKEFADDNFEFGES